MDGKWERIIIEYQCGLGYQLALFMANSNDDLKKKSSLKKQSPQIIPAVAKNSNTESNTETENASVLFQYVKLPRRKNQCMQDKWWIWMGKWFFQLVTMTHGALMFPLEIVLKYYSMQKNEIVLK